MVSNLNAELLSLVVQLSDELYYLSRVEECAAALQEYEG